MVIKRGEIFACLSYVGLLVPLGFLSGWFWFWFAVVAGSDMWQFFCWLSVLADFSYTDTTLDLAPLISHDY
jgi:hypothetical protein